MRRTGFVRFPALRKARACPVLRAPSPQSLSPRHQVPASTSAGEVVGANPNRKGADFERAVAKALSGQRVPLSGAVAAFPGDVVANLFGKRVRIECKKRATGFKQIYAWLRDNGMLVAGADRMDPLSVQRLADVIEQNEKYERVLAFAIAHGWGEDDTPDTPSDWGRTGN